MSWDRPGCLPSWVKACIRSAMKSNIAIACFGAAHWDYIAQAHPGHFGPDRPGTVHTRPGGVAANVALGLAGLGFSVDLLTVVGRDPDGEALLATLNAAGVRTSNTLISDDVPTGRYVAVEDETGELAGAVADCRAIDGLPAGGLAKEAVAEARFWFVEANLPAPILEEIASAAPRPSIIANPVSPARAGRLRGILDRIAILYCNRGEAEEICGASFSNSDEAAQALRRKGVTRAVVTDGPAAVCDASADGIVCAEPDLAGFASATGAGDAFLSRHLAAIIAEMSPMTALHAALNPQGKERV